MKMHNTLSIYLLVIVVLVSCRSKSSTKTDSTVSTEHTINETVVTIPEAEDFTRIASNDVEKMNLNGPVQYTSTEHYKGVEKFGEVVKGDPYIGEPFRTVIFNEHGNVSFSKIEHLGMNYLKEEKFEYNQKGEILSIDGLNETTSFIYDSDNKLMEKLVHDDNGVLVGKN